MSRYPRSRSILFDRRERIRLLKDCYHIIPYPPRKVLSRSGIASYNRLFQKFFKSGCTPLKLRLFDFEGYWIAIQLYGGEMGLLNGLRVVGENFEAWCDRCPRILENFRNQARERGYEHPDISTNDHTVYADVENPITVSKEEAKEYFAKYAQPYWIVSRASHMSRRHNGNWPGVRETWGGCDEENQQSNPEQVRIVIEDEDEDEGEDEDKVDDEDENEVEDEDENKNTDEVDDEDNSGEDDEYEEEDSEEGQEDDNCVCRSLREILDLRQRAMSGNITWQEFVDLTEDIAASVAAADDGVTEETAPDEHGENNSSALSSNPESEAPEEPSDSGLRTRMDANNHIDPRKRPLEDDDPTDGARSPPGPARWEAEFNEEAVLDMSRTLSAPSRRLAITKTAHQGETWYVLAWGTQAAGMSAGVAQAVQWIFANHIEGSARWSGLSLRFVLKFSRMGQYAVVGKVAEAPLSQETVNKLVKGAHAGSLQTPIAAQARTAAALVSRLLDRGEGTVLQEMMGLGVADLIAERTAIDDSRVAAILGGDPAEYMENRKDQGQRAVSPGFIDLE